MKKYLLIALAIAAALAALHALRRALEPEEARVRRLITGMVDGFNRSRAGGVLDGLAEGFIDQTAKVGRPEVHAFLAYLFFKERDPASKRFRYRAEVSEPEVALAAPAEPGAPPRADVTLQANFLELRGDGFVPVWTAAIHAALEKGPEGWQVVRTTHDTVEGKRPWR